VLEMAGYVEVTKFLCTIMDTDFGEHPFQALG
jgi:hypothetical protein